MIPCLGGSDGVRERGPERAECRVRSPFSSLDDTNATGKGNLNTEFRNVFFYGQTQQCRSTDCERMQYMCERVCDVLMFSS